MRTGPVWVLGVILILGGIIRADAAGTLTFVVGSTNGMANSQVLVPILARNFTSVSSFQFSLHWNTSVASFIGVEQLNLPGLATNNDSFGMPSNNTLTVAWLDSEPSTTVPDNTVLFALRFHLGGPPASSTSVTINGSPTEIVAGDENGNAIPTMTINGTLSVDHTLLFSCPTNKTVECGTAWNFDPLVILDTCLATTNGASVSVLSIVTNANGACDWTATCTWQISDVCSNRATCSQTVRVKDTTPPQVVCAGSKTTEFGFAWNFDEPVATDNCISNPIARVLSTVTNSSGRCGLTFAATRTWEISDSCTNKSICSQTVTVQDTTAPTITCSPTKNVSCLAAWSFDVPTAVDFPGIAVTNVAVIGTVTNGTCGNNFSATRTWRATDACGNTSTCSQTVLGHMLVDVSGTIFSPTNYPPTLSDNRVPNVTVLGPTTTVTATDGVYHCVFNAVSNVVITPVGPLGGNPADGVSTLDISLTRRHILAVAALDSPYKLLAADSDGSGTISTLDLSAVRRVILGLTNRFSAGLWRFVPANHVFTNVLAPWGAPTNRTYPNVNADVSGQNFVAIKLGDVNNSWMAPAGDGMRKRTFGEGSKAKDLAGSPNPVVFTIGSNHGLPGSEALIPIRVSAFSNVVGFQFSLHWDPLVAAFAGFDPFGLPFNPQMYNTNPAPSGTITFAWTDDTGGATTLPDGAAVITLRFRCTGSPSNTTSLTVDDIPTAREVDADLGAGPESVPYSFVAGQLGIDPSNHAPVLGNVSDKTVDEKVPLTFTATASDADNGQSHTFSLDPGAPAGASINAASGVFTWTPTEAQGPGLYFITVRVTDSGTPPLSDAKTMMITVNEVNSAPIANADTYNVNEDGLLALSAPGVLGNDTDPDSDALSAFLVSTPTHGTLTLNTNGSFSYRPATNYHGPDSFIYYARDSQTNSPTATVTITVNSVNDAPVAASDSYSVNEDSALVIGVPGVLSNDNDVDGQALSAVLATGPSHGTLTLNPNGSFSYMPATNFNGSDSFTYRTSDGQTNSGIATVSITVDPVNDAPVANGDSYSVNEDLVLNVAAAGVLTNDTDVDGDALTAVLVTGPEHGSLTLNTNGSFTYIPVTNFNGSDSFTYRVSDGRTNSGVVAVSLAIKPLNEAPTANADSYTVNEDVVLTVAAPGVLGNDTDSDGDAVRAALVSGPSHGTIALSANGSFTYTPAKDFSGSDSFIYCATDGQTKSPSTTVTITVNPVNDPPLLAPIGTKFATSSNSLVFTATATDVDVPAQTLTFSLEDAPAGASIDPVSGVFTWTPDEPGPSTNYVTIRVTDSGSPPQSATETISIIVDAIVRIAISDQTVPGGTSGMLEAAFEVTLSSPSAQFISVDFATADDTATADVDYLAASGTVIFPPGITNQTVEITVIGRSSVHGHRRFFVHLNNPTNAILDLAQGTGTITDEPAAALSINDLAALEGDPKVANNAAFEVNLWPPSDQLVRVKYAVIPGVARLNKDFRPRRGVLKFLPGVTNQIITVPVVGDTLSESNETFFVNLSASVNAVIARGQAMGTIVDNDPLPAITIQDAKSVEADTGVRRMNFTVQLSARSGRPISVDFATEDGTAFAGADYVSTNGTIFFPPGTALRKVTVLVSGDRLSEEDEAFFVNLSNAVNADIGRAQAVGTVRNDDAASATRGVEAIRPPRFYRVRGFQ